MKQKEAAQAGKIQREQWDRIATKARRVDAAFAGIKVAFAETKRPWLRLAIDPRRGGLYVDAFQKELPMRAGIYFEGRQRSADFEHFKNRESEIARAFGAVRVHWAPEGRNKQTANIVVEIKRSLSEGDCEEFENHVIQLLTRFHVIYMMCREA